MAFIASLLLTACSTPPPVFTPVAVDRPIAVPCHAPEVAEPDWPLRHVAPTASLADKVKAALIERDLRQAYEARIAAALAACQ